MTLPDLYMQAAQVVFLTVRAIATAWTRTRIEQRAQVSESNNAGCADVAP